MRKINTILHLKILIAFLVLNFVSCSKDSDEPDQPETSITVSTQDFSTTMDENPANGQLIGTVQGSTNQGSVTFSITEQTPAGAFSVNASSGELKVADKTLFDFENNPVITGTVKVSNGTVFENAAVTINLNEVYEDNVFEGDVILLSQQEVDDFGANNYTKVTGSVMIGEGNSPTDIFTLIPLQTLRTINQDLLIINNPNLTTTEGLNINNIGGQLGVALNSSLVKLDGFNNLTSVFDLILSNNNALWDLSGLSQIVTINDRIEIFSCPMMPNLNWLSNLTTIGNSLYIRYCTSMTDIDGLSNLTNITGQYRFFQFSHNTALKNLNGLRNLNTNIFRLELGYNLSLLNIEGLENINITNTLYIHDNPVLTTLTGVESITRLSDELFINDNNSLNDLQGLRNINSALEIHLYRNGSLSSLDGLNNLRENWKTDIQGNGQLTDFCALRNLFLIAPPTVYYAAYNAYNPTKQDIINGNCSL